LLPRRRPPPARPRPVEPEDLKAINVPTLVLHGEDDQVVPIDDASRITIKLLKTGALKTYPGYPHGMCTTPT
jgi:non-heme chloroperoxidase